MYIANLAIANVGYSAHEAFIHGGGRYGLNAPLGVDFPRGYRPAEEEKAPDGRTSWRGEEHNVRSPIAGLLLLPADPVKHDMVELSVAPLYFSVSLVV